MQELIQLSKLIEKLRGTNSTNSKIAIIKEHPECKKILSYVFDPMRVFGVTSSNVKKRKGELVSPIIYDSIFDLLDALCERKITGYLAIASINYFCSKNPEYEDLIHNIIDKDLYCRIDAKLINKAFPSLIPTFEVALAKVYEDYADKIDLNKERWYASRKLDGVRCIAVKQGDNIEFFSRQGKKFYTLDKLRNSLLNINMESCVIDGEVCIINEQGVEDFKAIVSDIRRKDYIIENPKYMVFDLLTLDEFLEGKSKRIFSERLARIPLALHYCDRKVDILQQNSVGSINVLDNLKEKVASNGWEGLILRRDTIYEAKRTKDMLKVKTFFDDEFVVERLENNSMRVTVEDELGNTKEVEEILMAKAYIRYKGYEVGIGSGWNLEERRRYYAHPEELIGKVITVQYFGESTNDQGGLSLRFPTVKYNYGEDRDM